jgi:glycosyltransferase involved in cell wall biosynthesis
MHIAVFLPNLAGGGAERSFLKISGGIAARDYQVDLVLARKEGVYIDEVPQAVKIINLNATRDILSLFGLVRYLRSKTPDILLSGMHTNIIAIWAKHLARVPTKVVVSERNIISRKTLYYASDPRMRILPTLIKVFYPYANCILAVSQNVADDLSKIAGITRDRIKVIYNPVITPELKEKMMMPIDDQWFAPGQIPVVLSVGRLTPQKDFRTLIKAFRIVKNNHPSRLLILGEGEERLLLENLIFSLELNDDIRMPGFVLNPYPYMARASVFVLSSKWEGLPGVLIEAAYCGSPLVATDCPGGSKEILKDGLYGDLVPVGDEIALAKAIMNNLVQKTPPPQNCWLPFEQDHVMDQYNQLFSML